ncbi:unnamed protein product [Caenorhabditis bovis]|uniref:Phosphodiesterase n=1 Tax=Caenorhabditis bovis TaxID=2654633 RepID=A0A8S1EI11_9PELO|nr:unnamed protein product [Caenorhabditis bovis]
MRNRNLQLQLRNRGTKDDWGASIRYDIDDTPTSYLNQFGAADDDDSLSSDGGSTPPVSPTTYLRFMSLTDDLQLLVRDIIDEAKRSLNAEACAIFILDEVTKELVAKIFDNGPESQDELRVPFGHGVVGRVALTRTLMNIRNAQRCPFFYPNVDQTTGFRTKNILCFPVIDNSGLMVGVAEICNKKDSLETGFSRRDEKFAKNFGIHCATCIAHSIFYKKIQETYLKSHMATEMMVQGVNVVIPDDDIQRLVTDPRRDWRYFNDYFDDFAFAPRSIGENHFHKASMTFFEDLGFTYQFRINKRKLSYLVLRISAGYRPVPYHNWSHAFAVAHFCWLVLRTDACKQNLDDVERLSLLIACLCHDIDHRGTTNSFQLQSKTPLAQLYSSEGSVLERHHYAQTVSILTTPECDILSHLPAGQYRSILSNIREVILATDIAAHLKKVAQIQKMVKAGFRKSSIVDHYMLSSLIMTASDLSDQSKNFHNAKLIAENIYTEFFAQGDLENEIGVTPLEMMDRHKAFVPQVQIEFLDTIGLPVFKMLSEVIPDGKSTYESICANRVCWQALHEEMSRVDPTTLKELDYLRDEEIEKKVFERVRAINPTIADIASKRVDLKVNGRVAYLASPDEFGHMYDGYDIEAQTTLPGFECSALNNNTIRATKQRKATMEATRCSPPIALLKDDDDDERDASSRQRTPRRLWRRARDVLETMSSTCVGSCSPRQSRRHLSDEDDDDDDENTSQ